jgi:hypothetical protein
MTRPDEHGHNQGLTTLAFKVAYDLFSNPGTFEQIIDRATGKLAQTHRKKDGSEVSIFIKHSANGTTEFQEMTKWPDGSITTESVNTIVNRKRYYSSGDVKKLKLQYKKLVTLEKFSLKQLFFLNSINNVSVPHTVLS